VKNPKACKDCQKARQRANEKAWRNKHLGLYDGKYHQVKRECRKVEIQAKVKDLARCIEVGGTLLGVAITKEIKATFQEIFLKFLIGIGIRRANKFWPLKIPSPNGMF
jgi:16S rRNA U516 pseudouridylate synthase RsuA-like enzyme